MWSVTLMEMVYERKPLLSLEMGQLWREAKNPKRQSKGQVGNINFFMVHLHTVHFFCPCSILLLRGGASSLPRPFCFSPILISKPLESPLSSLSPSSPVSPWLSAYLHGHFAWLWLTVLTDSIIFLCPGPLIHLHLVPSSIREEELGHWSQEVSSSRFLCLLCDLPNLWVSTSIGSY